MRELTLSSLDFIQLFGEGAGGAAGAEGAGGEGPAGQNDAAIAQPQNGRRNPLADVQYGKPEEEAEAPVAAEQKEPVDRAAEFEKMIKGEYKDLYAQRIQDTISKRLKGTEETVKKYKALEQSLDLLGNRYGIDPSNAEALAAAIEEDESFFEEEALQSGKSVRELQEKRRMKRENARLTAQLDEMTRREQADRQYGSWLQEGEQLKQIYPSFDLAAEVKNDQFLAMLSSGVSVKTAFEVAHKDELISGAMQYASRQAEEKVANSILAGQRRPAEGAMASRATSLRKTDVTQLTRADRDEIERRVARGEKIRF